MSSGKFVKGFWSVLMCTVLVSGISFAKERYGSMERQQSMTESSNMATQSNIPGREGYLQSCNKTIGMDIKNVNGDKLGDVKDLVLDQGKNRINYAILSHEGKLYPVPWTALSSGDKTYTLDLTSDNLKSAPTIESLDNLNQFSGDLKQKVDDFYSKQMSSHERLGERGTSWMKEKGEQTMNTGEQAMNTGERAVGIEPKRGMEPKGGMEPKDIEQAKGTEQAAGFFKVSDVLKCEFQDNQGKKIASCYDVLFDTREGNIAYCLAHVGGVAGVGAKTAAVPWSAIQPDFTNRIAKLSVDKNTLESAEIPKGEIAKLNDPTFARQIHQTFGKEPYWEVYGYVPPAAAAGAGLSASAWNPDSEYNKHFDAAAITTVEATVKSVSTFTPQRGAAPGLELKVETNDGKSETIHAGPESYYKSQGIQFNEGDKITITGSKTRIGLKSIIMATEIKKGDQTLKLRDPQGKPEWKMDMMQGERRPGSLSEPTDTNKVPETTY